MFRSTRFLVVFVLCLAAALHARSNHRPASLPAQCPARPDKAARKFSLIKPPLLAQKGLIIIDPGHGGHDVGTQSISKPRYQEKTLNLATAQFLKRYLQRLGYRVLMTREEDRFVSLEARAQLANEQKPLLFVSIHYNSAPSAEAQGVEVFIYHSKDPLQRERLLHSKRLAHAVLRQVIACTQAKSRGVKQANYAVIRETTMPAILIEGGFVTNSAELQRLKDPLYLKRIAWGIMRGIQDYILHEQ